MGETADNQLKTNLASIKILQELAQEHVEKSRGALELLPADPDAYPAQSAYYLTGDPIDPPLIDNVATVAEPLFPQLKSQLISDENGSALGSAGELLAEGKNVVIATNHSQLIDIALAQAAVYEPLKQHAADFSSAIVLGKMISVVSFKLGDQHIPAVDAIKMLCDDIYISFPRTKSISNSRLAQDYGEQMTVHNKKMSTALVQKLGGGGVLLAVAPSGTTDDKLSQESSYTMGVVNKGTADLLRQDNTYVLPMAIWIDADTPVLQTVSEPQKLESRDDVHDMMSSIATTLNERVDSQRFSYGKSMVGAGHR